MSLVILGIIIFVFGFAILVTSLYNNAELDKTFGYNNIISAIILAIALVWLTGYSSQPFQIEKVEVLNIHKIVNDDGTYQQVVTFNNTIKNITKDLGAGCDGSKYVVERTIYKKGPYCGLYWEKPDIFKIIPKTN